MAANELREKNQTVNKESVFTPGESYMKEQDKLKEKYPIIIKEKLIDHTLK